MPAFATAAAHRTLRTGRQLAAENLLPDSIIIGSKIYACAVTLGAITEKLAADGINFRMGQDASIYIQKTILATAPAVRTEITINGLVFRVVDSGPQSDVETAWHITARRFV